MKLDSCDVEIEKSLVESAGECVNAYTLASSAYTYLYSCKDPQSTDDTCLDSCQTVYDNLEEVCTGKTFDFGGTEVSYVAEYKTAMKETGPASCSYASTSAANSISVPAVAILATVGAALLSVA